MKYSVGIETRKKILLAAKQLFLEKGYTATTFTDICRSAQIKQGSLTYHFKNKLEIGQIINSELLQDSISLSDSLTKGSEDPFYHFSMNIVCFSYQYFHDPAFQRFTAEFALESMKYDINEYVEYYMIRQNLPVPEQLLTTKRGKLDLISVVYLDNIIPAYLRSHMDEFDYEESALYMLEMYNKILFGSDPVFNDNIKRAVSVFQSYLADSK